MHIVWLFIHRCISKILEQTSCVLLRVVSLQQTLNKIVVEILAVLPYAICEP